MKVSRFVVDVVEQPTLREEEAGGQVRDIMDGERILAGSKDAALLIAGTKIKKDVKLDQARLVVNVSETPLA